MDTKEITKEIEHIFTTYLGLTTEELTPDLRYGFTQKWNSRAHMLLISKLEESFHIVLNPSDMLKIDTLENIAQVISENLKNRG